MAQEALREPGFGTSTLLTGDVIYDAAKNYSVEKEPLHLGLAKSYGSLTIYTRPNVFGLYSGIYFEGVDKGIIKPPFSDFAQTIHQAMTLVAIDQKRNGEENPSFNIIFCQDLDPSGTTHCYVEIRSGESNGFQTVMPQYMINGVRVKPDLNYEEAADIARRLRI